MDMERETVSFSLKGRRVCIAGFPLENADYGNGFLYYTVKSMGTNSYLVFKLPCLS